MMATAQRWLFVRFCVLVFSRSMCNVLALKKKQNTSKVTLKVDNLDGFWFLFGVKKHHSGRNIVKDGTKPKTNGL